MRLNTNLLHKTCFFLCFLLLHPILNFSQTVPLQGLISQFKFDESSSTAAVNSIDASKPGILNNISRSAGVSGTDLELNGLTSSFTVTQLNNAGFPNFSTLSFWIKGDFTTQNNLAVFDAYRTTGNHIFIRTNTTSNGLQIVFQNSSGKYVSLNLVPITANTWTNISIVCDTKNHVVHIYKNGVLFSTTAIVQDFLANQSQPIDTWKPDNQNFVFGKGFIGGIDNILVYNRALSRNEISAIFNNTAAPIVDVTPSSLPKRFAATYISATKNFIGWDLSSDGDIAGYSVFKNGMALAYVNKSNSTWIDNAISSNTNNYSVAAFDYSGNTSISPTPITVNFDPNKQIFKTDFEADQTTSIQPPPLQIQGWDKQCIPDSTISITYMEKRAGNKSLKLSFDKLDWKPQLSPNENLRSEVLSNLPGSGPSSFDIGKTWWVGFSELLPANWISDVIANPETIWQFHGGVNGPASGSPPIAAYVIGDSIFVKLQTGTIPTVNGQSQITLAKLKIPKGIWLDWVIQVRFDLTNNGMVKIWNNCNLVTDYSGPTLYPALNTTNPTAAPYLKFGIYKYWWGVQPSSVNSRTVYVDEVRVANSNAIFTDVQPTGPGACVFH